MTITPFPKSAMLKKPPADAAPRALHGMLDVPQPVRLNASSLHQLAAKTHTTLGQHWASPVSLADAEDKLVELAERALALRAALVQERKRRAATAEA